MKTSLLKMTVAAASLALVTACSTTQVMEGSRVSPAAKGELTTSAESHGNTNLKLAVKHLAPPEKLAEGARNYVVWVQPTGTDRFQNIGALTVDSDLQGTYSTTIPHKSFKLLVTPEDSVAAVQPTGPAVFQDSVDL